MKSSLPSQNTQRHTMYNRQAFLQNLTQETDYTQKQASLPLEPHSECTMQDTDYTSPGTLLRVATPDRQTDYTKTEKSPPETIGIHQGADYTKNKQRLPLGP